MRYLPVEHAGNTQRSEEEAARIAVEIQRLLSGNVRDVDGVTRSLAPADVIVVTPYNVQVSCLRRVLDDRGLQNIEVGTVDKLQGREAYVVFFSTAASSPEDAPRGMSFVFDRQRFNFNVAVSRARALAVMVGAPALLVHRCTSVEHVQVANGLCRFIEESAIRYADADINASRLGHACTPKANYRTATAWLASRGLLAPGAVSAKATDDDRATIQQLTAERAQIER